MAKARILVLCEHNAVRSQMAEAFLTLYGGDYFHVYSAGINPQPIHPMTIEAMGDMDIDIRRQQSLSIDDVQRLNHFDVLMTLSDAVLPDVPADLMDMADTHVHWHIEDPSLVDGDYTEVLSAFHTVRDAIQDLVRQWVFERVHGDDSAIY